MKALLFAMAVTVLPLFAQAEEPTLSAAEAQQVLRDYFFDAARRGDTAMLSEFVAAGYPLNTRTEKDYTALILAAYYGHTGAVNLLIEAGADPCAKDVRGNTALMGAIFKGELAIARRLLATDCAPDDVNHAGQTAAMYAALFNRSEILQALVEQGADLKAKDAAGNSAEQLLQGEYQSSSISF